MRSKHVSRYGTQELFNMIDLNNSGTIEENEWKAFYDVLLNDFVKCDTNKDWMLQKEEATKCIAEQRWYQLIVNDGYCSNNCPREKVDPVEDLLEFSDRNADDKLTIEE